MARLYDGGFAFGHRNIFYFWKMKTLKIISVWIAALIGMLIGLAILWFDPKLFNIP